MELCDDVSVLKGIYKQMRELRVSGRGLLLRRNELERRLLLKFFLIWGPVNFHQIG